MRRLPTVLILLGAAIAPVIIAVRAADPPATGNQPSLKQQVEQLVHDLDADTLAQRRTAEQRLKVLGPAVLPFFPPPELISASTRETLNKVRYELERRLARESVGPSRVALQGTNTLDHWLRKLTEQTRNRLDTAELPTALGQRALTLDLKESSFWSALDEICRMASLEVQLGPRGTLVLKPVPQPQAGPIGSSGAFRAKVSSIQHTAGLGDEDLLRLRLQLLAEPRLRPLFVRFAMRDMRAGESSAPLPPLSPEAQTELLMSESRLAADPRLDFRLSKNDRRTHVDFQGRFHVTVAAGSEEIRFPNLRELAAEKVLNIARRRGGVTVKLRKIELQRQPDALLTARLDLLITWDAFGPAFESHRSWLLNNRVFLESARADDKGVKSVRELNGGLETTVQGNGAVGVIYTFRDLPVPLPEETFVYVAPTLIIDVPVDVEIKQISIPPKT